METYVSILSVVLLALVAGLLLALHFQMKEWKATAKQAPLLAEKLTEALMSARTGLAELKKELAVMGPDVSRLVEEGGKVRVELQFLLQKAEKMAEKLEKEPRSLRGGEDEGYGAAKLAPAVQAVVEQVAGANGMAARQERGTRNEERGADGVDPLAELLANLQGGVAEQVVDRHPPKKKRGNVVTQAELDLLEHMKGAA